MDDSSVSLDLGAFLRSVEARTVRMMIGASAMASGADPHAAEQMQRVMDCFTRHGVRATTALQIILEISKELQT